MITLVQQIITVSLTCDSSFSSGLRTRTSSGDSSNSDGSVNRNSDHSAICQQEESLPGVVSINIALLLERVNIKLKSAIIYMNHI